MPYSSTVSNGNPTDEDQYNDLRKDALYKLAVIPLLDANAPVEVVDGIASFRLFIPDFLDGFVLTEAHACVITASSSGTPTFQIYNVTDSVDMLSTRITIDASEKTSYTAATQPVIDTDHDDVATGDELRFDCDVAGTGTKGLTIMLTFEEA